MYNPIAPGDSISSTWGNAVEKALGYGTPAQPYSYTIWKTGSTYYARNGITGERTTNDSLKTLMNDAILALYGSDVGTGGSIFLNPGVYYVDGTINMRPGVHVFGSGRMGSDAWLVASKTLSNTLISATTDAPIFSFNFPAQGYHSGVHFMGLTGDSNVASYPLIDISCDSASMGDIFLDDISMSSGKYGIRVYNNHASNLIWNVFIERCFIEAFDYNAIRFDSPTDKGIFQCRLLRNHFYGNNISGGNGAIEIEGHETRGSVIAHNTFELENRHGIYLTDEADGWVISDNIIIDCGQLITNTYSGINLNDVDLCSVTGNVSIYRANNKMKYGYYADNNCTYLAVLGNVFKGQTAGAVFGTGTGNIGDATMNVSTT